VACGCSESIGFFFFFLVADEDLLLKSDLLGFLGLLDNYLFIFLLFLFCVLMGGFVL
jgi:hypothetical protein